jgi:hypothetical protein
MMSGQFPDEILDPVIREMEQKFGFVPERDAGAADKTKVDQATRQVDQGSKQIGQGKVGPGFKEMFTGIGHTIVEGAKFSGNTMGEFFKKTFGS